MTKTRTKTTSRVYLTLASSYDRAAFLDWLTSRGAVIERHVQDELTVEVDDALFGDLQSHDNVEYMMIVT